MTKILSERNLYKGYLEINQLTLENNIGEFTRDWLQTKDAVCAIVYDCVKKEYVFVKQFRVGPKKDVIELCAGLIDVEKGLTPMETMTHEVLEELGYEVDTITQLCRPFYTTPGKTNEKMWPYYVTVSKQVEKGGGLEIEHEEIEIISVPESEINNLEIEDGKTLLLLSIMKLL